MIYKTTRLIAAVLSVAANSLFSQRLYTTAQTVTGGAVIYFDVSGNNIGSRGLFSSVNIAMPVGKALHVGNGVFYGVTNNSPNMYGAIYRSDTSGSSIQLLYQFSNLNRSATGFVMANNGKLYTLGITGTSNTYAIYMFDTASKSYTQAYEIPGNSGSTPQASLIKGKNGLLYGVTQYGGTNAKGRLFSFDPSNNTFATLHNFDTPDGTQPNTSLLQASNGKLYGVCSYGGANDKGTLFSYDLQNNTFTKHYDFVQSKGENPTIPLMQANNGLLYGMTMTGGDNYQGVIYSYDIATATYTKLHSFFAGGGYGPRHKLIQASNGLLYGTANQGGSKFRGCIFSYDITNSTYTKLKDGDDSSAGNFVSPFIEFGDHSTGVGESHPVSQTLVYPNPAFDRLMISSDAPWTAYKVLNHLGQSLLDGELSGTSIPVDELEPGLYTLILRDDTGRIHHAAFLKGSR